MKISLKKIFILLTILTVLIPVVVFYLSYLHSVRYFENNSEITVNNARILTNGVVTKIEKNFNSINDYNGFNTDIMRELEETGSSMQIIGLDGEILYDSENAENIHNHVDIKSTLQYDLHFRKANPGFFKYTCPIVYQEKLIGNAVFIIPFNKLMVDSPEITSFKLLLPITIGVAIIILFIAYLLIKIVINLLIPVRNLKTAAYEISRGNLNTPLNYKRNDDLSSVFVAFDTMRLELKESLEKQAQYERAHRELIACISHDLKTPISSIKAYVEALEDGLAKDRETFNRYISVIKKKTDSLTKLIEDLFQHSQMQLQKLKIEKTEQYSKLMINSILEPIRMQLENSNIDFTVNNPLPDVLINADSQRIEQVVINLVQNAKKYMPNGGEIEFNALIENGYLKISVKDTGPGILPQDMPYIFQPFYRGDKSRTSKVEGTGLGLSICKYIVEEHGGKIYAKSIANEGSEFTFTIPKL